MNDWISFFGVNYSTKDWLYDVPNWNREFDSWDRDYRFYVQFHKCIFRLMDTGLPQRLCWFVERQEIKENDKKFDVNLSDRPQWELIKNHWTFNGYNFWKHRNNIEDYNEKAIVDIVYSEFSDFYEYREILEEHRGFVSTFGSFSHWYEITRHIGDHCSPNYELYQDFCSRLGEEIDRIEETIESVYVGTEPIYLYERPFYPDSEDF